jgi:hypothetical protein
MKKKALGLIEEINPNSVQLTDDPDIAAKQNDVINQRMFELARIKKIPKYAEMEVNEGDIITLEDIGTEVGYDVYQVEKIGGVKNTPKASGTVYKMQESGTAEIECFVYPERITDKTKDKAYEFELSADVLEIMAYGVAADLLKNDETTEYGTIYATTYESMKQQLDPRYQLNAITIEGGWSF